VSSIPFHADLSLAPGTALGPYPVIDPGAGAIRVKHIRVSSDTAQRIVVGTDDADGSRMVAGFLPGGGAGILADCDIATIGTGMLGLPVLVILGAASAVEVQIDGCYESMTP
jgi:hypothetical protein